MAEALSPSTQPSSPPAGLNGGSPSPGGETVPSPGAGAAPGAPPSEGDWRSTLSEDLRQEKGWERFRSVDNLARSYRDLERRMGERAPVRPGADATPEQRTAWRQYLGVPDTPDGYQPQRPAGLPEGREFDPQAQQEFLRVAHQLDLAPHQVQAIMDWEAQRVAQYNAQQEQESTESAQAGEQAGRSKWGAQWDIKLAMAQEYLRRQGSEELRHDLESLVVTNGEGKPILAGNHVGIIEMMAELAQLTGHAPYVIGEGGGILSQGSAKERLNAAYADHRAGTMTSEQLAQAVERYAPLAFSP